MDWEEVTHNKASGFVLITPTGAIWAETFRPTRDATKGWLAMQKMSDGRYHDWKHYYREGWRCKPATIQLAEPSNAGANSAGACASPMEAEGRNES